MNYRQSQRQSRHLRVHPHAAACGNSPACPAARFHAIGGFDVSFRRAAAEDRDLCGRWLEHGFRMIYAPEVVVYHRHALQPASFWRKHFNYGRGSYHYHQLHRALGLEPLCFYWNLLWIPLRGGRMPHSLRLCLVLVISQLANASGFAWAGLRQWTQRGVHADDTAD